MSGEEENDSAAPNQISPESKSAKTETLGPNDWAINRICSDCITVNWRREQTSTNWVEFVCKIICFVIFFTVFSNIILVYIIEHQIIRMNDATGRDGLLYEKLLVTEGCSTCNIDPLSFFRNSSLHNEMCCPNPLYQSNHSHSVHGRELSTVTAVVVEL